MKHLGIDFGTTNSALAWTEGEGPPSVATFRLHGEVTRTFRSLLYFEADREWVRGRPQAWVGPEAIEHYLLTDGDGRLMQSMKTFLASRVVKGTQVFGCDFPLERLIALIIDGVFGASGLPRPRRLVAGRPVRFAGSDSDADDELADSRLRKAFAFAGFEDIELVLEPVAAALHYEAGLAQDETVLVADFGGGTSDFCLLKVGPSYRHDPTDRARILGTRGVGVAGDALDARLIQYVVAPELGADTLYRSQSGNFLQIPPGIFEKLRKWNELSFLKSRQNMDMLLGYLRTAVEPKKVKALVQVVEHDLGHRLYRAIERTKVDLSSREEAELVFADGDIDLRAKVSRRDFEGWIRPELDAISRTVDQLMTDTGLAAAAVDTVFLTGGTGQVPAVRELFATRFGEGKLRTGDFLTSIASGLALHARQLDRGVS